MIALSSKKWPWRSKAFGFQDPYAVLISNTYKALWFFNIIAPSISIQNKNKTFYPLNIKTIVNAFRDIMHYKYQ